MANEWWWKSVLPAASVIIVALLVRRARGANTACISNQLDWYSSVVGESPCMTYQRLRQICNSEYQVPSFPSTVPPDRCDDSVSDCCCNMVAFQLSMLCMVCQQDVQDSGVGIDAPMNGTYTVYRGTCGAGANHTLQSKVQSAICNENVRIDDFLYDSWDSGAWFYRYTRDNAQLLHAANNNNTFTHCPNQMSSSLTPTSASSTLTSHMSGTENTQSPSPTPTQNQSKSKLIGGIVGGILGAVVIIAAVAIWRHKKARGSALQGTWGVDPFRYKGSIEAPRVSVRAHSFTANRASGENPGVTSPGAASALNNPFMSAAEISSVAGTVGAPTSVPPVDPTSFRYRDSGSFGVGQVAHSDSGQLPPAYYDHAWEDTLRRQRPTQPDSMAGDLSGAQTMRGAFPLSASKLRVPGEGARLPSGRKHR